MQVVCKCLFLLLSIMRNENSASKTFSLPFLWAASHMCSLDSHMQSRKWMTGFWCYLPVIALGAHRGKLALGVKLYVPAAGLIGKVMLSF